MKWGRILKLQQVQVLKKIRGIIVAILTALEPGDVLFIDEIHRLNKVVEEILYPAMEDFLYDVVIGKEHLQDR